MLKKSGKISAVILALLLLFSTSAFAYTDTSYKKPLAVVNGGDQSSYPANSIMAIKSCIDLNIGGVKLTVRKTSDNVLVLIESDSTKGILADEKSAETNLSVSKTPYSTLEKLYLLSGTNNKQRTLSSYKLTTLDEALTVSKGKIQLFLYCENAILDNVYDSVLSKNAFDDVILCSNMKNADFIKWANGKEKKPTIMAYHKSNVIFAAVNQLNIAKENNLDYIQYATNNQYGVIFSHFFMKKTDDINVYFSFTNDKACGKRPDNVEGWEDVIARGYNIIESNNCQEIAEYFKMTETNRQALLQTISDYEKINTNTYSFVTVKNLTEAFKDADQLIKSGTGSASNLSKANTALKNAISGLEPDDHSIPVGKFTVTTMRIFWMIFALLLFAAVNIYIYKKTKKQ